MSAKGTLDVCRWLQRRGLSASELVVAHAIAHRMNEHGEAWPSLACLAADTGLTVRGVTGVLRRLERKRILERTRRRREDGGYTSTLYRLLLEGWQGDLPLGTTFTGVRNDVPKRSERPQGNVLRDFPQADPPDPVDNVDPDRVAGLPPRLRRVVEKHCPGMLTGGRTTLA